MVRNFEVTAFREILMQSEHLLAEIKHRSVALNCKLVIINLYILYNFAIHSETQEERRCVEFLT
jgi:hypothetical protein